MVWNTCFSQVRKLIVRLYNHFYLHTTICNHLIFLLQNDTFLKGFSYNMIQIIVKYLNIQCFLILSDFFGQSQFYVLVVVVHIWVMKWSRNITHLRWLCHSNQQAYPCLIYRFQPLQYAMLIILRKALCRKRWSNYFFKSFICILLLTNKRIHIHIRLWCIAKLKKLQQIMQIPQRYYFYCFNAIFRIIMLNLFTSTGIKWCLSIKRVGPHLSSDPKL